MQRFIKSYANDAAIQEAVDNKSLGKPYVALNDATGEIDWDNKFIDYSKMYFTIEVLEDGNILFGGSDLYFSKNGGEWGTGSNLDVSAGDRIRFKGNLPNAENMLQNNTLQMNVYGNIQSLFYGDNFEGQTTVKSLGLLFQGCTGLVDASNLVLPATTLLGYCYKEMFYGCTSLTKAPALPATTLVSSCYYQMFKGCTGLTTAPALPATTLAYGCYQGMFDGCSSLTTAPALPATSLVNNCYQHMFNSCTNLTTAPELPATTLANRCYYGMFNGCTSLATAPELPATTLVEECYYNMFNKCGSLTTAPELPATTLAKNCCRNMFSGCASLNYIKCLATDISASGCTDSWVQNVSPTGTFVKKAGVEWPTGNSGIPRNWTVIEE